MIEIAASLYVFRYVIALVLFLGGLVVLAVLAAIEHFRG